MEEEGSGDWLIGLGIAAVTLLASWVLLIILAKRLPPGVLRDMAAFIPDCVTTVRRLRKDPRVTGRAKIAIIMAGMWVATSRRRWSGRTRSTGTGSPFGVT